MSGVTVTTESGNMENGKAEAAAVWVPTAELKAWQENPRQNDKAVPAVMESIKRFGFASPIIARPNGEVIAGHTRLKAALELRLDRVPVRYMDLDPADAKLLALADNRSSELADWDDEGLAAILRDLEAEEVDLSGIGWDLDDLAEMMSDEPFTLDDQESEGPDLDAIPEEVPAITKPGEVITLGRHTLHCKDCLDVMRSLPDCSVDAICTDPPYGIGFMGKGWDCAVPGEAFAAEAVRVLKPGGHLIAFAATRTVHRLTVALEDAGLEIRDQIAWVQWQGFPKSHDISKGIDAMHGAEREVVGEKIAPDGKPASARLAKRARGGAAGGVAGDKYGTYQNDPIKTTMLTAPATEDAKKWEGWGSALKPAYEPAVLARKPLEGTLAENTLAHGVGGLNIDGCRYAYGDPAWPGPNDDCSGAWDGAVSTNIGASGGAYITTGKQHRVDLSANKPDGRWPANLYACPKASRGEREAGCEAEPLKRSGVLSGRADGSLGKITEPRANNHPTVKPSGLTRWLVRLITPPGATVLEPFAGSGTTLLAAEAEGVTCIAIEREPAYCDIARARYQGALDAG